MFKKRKNTMLLMVALLFNIFSLTAKAADDSHLYSLIKHADGYILFPEKVVKIGLVNKLTKYTGKFGTICKDYAPEFLVPDVVSSASCLSCGLPWTVTVIGDGAGYLIPYVHVYKGIKSIGMLATYNSKNSGEDFFNILTGLTSGMALYSPNMFTLGAYTLSKLGGTANGIYSKKSYWDFAKSNAKSLYNLFSDDFAIDNSESTFLTAKAKINARALGGRIFNVSEPLISSDLRFITGIFGNSEENLSELEVDTLAGQAFVKLKGTWVWGKEDDFFASHTSPHLEGILKVAAQFATLRSVTKKFGQGGLAQLVGQIAQPDQINLAVKAGNTRYTAVYEVRIAPDDLENPVYVGEDDTFVERHD